MITGGRALPSLALATIVVLGLAGCSRSAAGDAAQLLDSVRAIDGVTHVEIYGEQPSAGFSVDVDPAADVATVLAAVRRISELAEDAEWKGHVVVQPQTPFAIDPATDFTVQAAWTVTAYPGDRDEVATWVGTLFELADDDSIIGSAFTAEGWPSVIVRNLDEFAEVVRRATSLPGFERGGTFFLDGDHLQLVFVPTRSTHHVVEAIVQLAIDYPDAEILLQATTAGPQWPMLLIARLTVEQAAEIDRRLRHPSLSDADRDGLPVDFQLTAITDHGPEYTAGTFGDVPKA